MDKQDKKEIKKEKYGKGKCRKSLKKYTTEWYASPKYWNWPSSESK